METTITGKKNDFLILYLGARNTKATFRKGIFQSSGQIFNISNGPMFNGPSTCTFLTNNQFNFLMPSGRFL